MRQQTDYQTERQPIIIRPPEGAPGLPVLIAVLAEMVAQQAASKDAVEYQSEMKAT